MSQKPSLIIDRVKALEELTNGLAGFVQNELPPLKSALSNVVEVLNAVIKASGGEEFSAKVQTIINEARAERAKEQAEAQKAMLAKAVEQGLLVATERVAPGTIIVGRELDTDGTVIGAGYAQVRFDQFTPEAQAQVNEQGVGFVIDGPSGKFEVLEVYEQGKPAEPAVTPAETTPAAE